MCHSPATPKESTKPRTTSSVVIAAVIRVCCNSSHQPKPVNVMAGYIYQAGCNAEPGVGCSCAGRGPVHTHWCCRGSILKGHHQTPDAFRGVQHTCSCMPSSLLAAALKTLHAEYTVVPSSCAETPRTLAGIAALISNRSMLVHRAWHKHSTPTCTTRCSNKPTTRYSFRNKNTEGSAQSLCCSVLHFASPMHSSASCFSSTSSSAVALSLAALKSSIGRPCTMLHLPSLQVTGKL